MPNVGVELTEVCTAVEIGLGLGGLLALIARCAAGKEQGERGTGEKTWGIDHVHRT